MVVIFALLYLICCERQLKEYLFSPYANSYVSYEDGQLVLSSKPHPIAMRMEKNKRKGLRARIGNEAYTIEMNENGDMKLKKKGVCLTVENNKIVKERCSNSMKKKFKMLPASIFNEKNEEEIQNSEDEEDEDEDEEKRTKSESEEESAEEDDSSTERMPQQTKRTERKVEIPKKRHNGTRCVRNPRNNKCFFKLGKRGWLRPIRMPYGGYTRMCNMGNQFDRSMCMNLYGL